MIVLDIPGWYTVEISPKFTEKTFTVRWATGIAMVYFWTWRWRGDPVPPEILADLQEREDQLLEAWRNLHP